MPTTKRQGIVYGLFMTVFMTCGMELYNNAVKLGVNLMPGGLSNMDWTVVIGMAEELPLMLPVVFVLSNLYGNRLGRLLAGRIVDPKRDSELMRTIATVACTTLIMCPSMSLFASVLFNVALAGRPLVELPVIWVGTVLKNFPMALMWNLFFATPMSRFCLGRLVRLSRARANRRIEVGTSL